LHIFSLNIKAVGCTPAGLQYLITKSMLQASKALNLSLYLLLKSDKASTKSNTTPKLESQDNSFLMDDDVDDILSHPVMDRLNQLSQLTDKLRENVEDKTPGLEKQMHSLVKAAALMKGESVEPSESDESSSDGESDNANEDIDDAAIDTKSDNTSSSANQVSAVNSDASSSSDDEESEAAIQRRILTEAKFALRNQDIDNTVTKSSKKRNRRLAPPSSMDYGDDVEEASERAMEAGRKLASTMNSISQKSSSKGKKNQLLNVEDADDEYEQLQRGLSMMDQELGMGSDVDEGSDDGADNEGFSDADGDDFYSKIKSKSRAKKEAKKQMYAVAPKYPRLEADVEGKIWFAYRLHYYTTYDVSVCSRSIQQLQHFPGERAIGRAIMKNRGLVPHKPKINRNPRVKKREQYRKALIRRKGAVREVRTEESHAYGGETTGIKSGISRSRKLGGGR
jgi:U3 small nucleolar RNA-associated protein 3